MTSVSVLRRRRDATLAAAVLAVLMCGTGSASAQSLLDALAATYSNNPTLNAARAQARATDETIGIAKGQGRPRVTGSVSATTSATDARRQPFGSSTRWQSTFSDTSSISIQIVQPLYAGGRITNGIRQAEAFVKARQQQLRNTEQDILFDAAEAYMNVIRDTALVQLSESNQRFLAEQVRAARDRFNVGEGTRTDVALADARLQSAIASINSAKANLNTSRAVFRQIIGVEPKKLSASNLIDRLIPKDLNTALNRGQSTHPGILASLHNVDAAVLNVKVAEGALLPSVNLQASVSQSWAGGDVTGSNLSNSRQLGINATVPIYQGGGEYAEIRQAKEELGEARVQVDVVRDRVRAGVVTAWGQLQSASASITAARAQIEASQLALSGVIEEQRVGQRTTLDVLNAQSELINAQVQLVRAETLRVIAAFGVVQASGLLDQANLRLPAKRYEPTEHLDAVKDQWIGMRTPDGR